MKKFLKKLRHAIRTGIISTKIQLDISVKRLFHRQLFILISTPFYGNVGDHTIELAQKEILRTCGVAKNLVDISSFEYKIVEKRIKKSVRKSDVIIIDGGGNFGDTWPETMMHINGIVSDFSENRIFIFPESWYFSESDKGNELLAATKETFEKVGQVVLYARDSWSCEQMKKHLPRADVKYSFDAVLFKEFTPKEASRKRPLVGLCIREDKESSNAGAASQITEMIKSSGLDSTVIKNDCYTHIKKSQRKKYFKSVISQYERCSHIVTDRFHGFIFSILCRKPCMIIDNLTGKVHHFYGDIKDDIEGCIVADESTLTRESFDGFISGDERLILKDSFTAKKEKYRNDIASDIIAWRE